MKFEEEVGIPETNELNEVYNKVRALKKSIEQAENYE